jgi:hypothetical protein
MNVKDIESIEEVTGRKLIKYYAIYMLVKLGIGLLGLGIAFAVAWIGLQLVVSNAPIPRLP